MSDCTKSNEDYREFVSVAAPVILFWQCHNPDARAAWDAMETVLGLGSPVIARDDMLSVWLFYNPNVTTANTYMQAWIDCNQIIEGTINIDGVDVDVLYTASPSVLALQQWRTLYGELFLDCPCLSRIPAGSQPA